MSPLRTITSLVVLLVLASSAHAVDLSGLSPKIATVTPIPAQSPGQVVSNLSTSIVAGIPVYDALTLGTSFLATNALSPVDGLAYVEYADDCHLSSIGALTGFTMGYYNPLAGTASALITFYQGDGGDTILGPIVAGPYLVVGLPTGLNIVIVTPPDSPFLPADVWFAIQFSPAAAGLVIAGGPPTTGTSHDVFADTGLTTPPPGLVFFGGSPLANFMIAIEADVTVPVQETTWGQVKALYNSTK